jgi:hypothetical protein
MEQLLTKLADIAPVIGVLVYFIWYFKGELKSKDTDYRTELAAKNEEIKQLNELLRNQTKENLIAITKMTEVVERLTELIKEKL